MKTIAVDKTPVIIGDKNVVEFEVNKIGTLAFQRIASETTSLVGPGKQWPIQNKRLRIKHQVRAITESGEKLSLDDLAISQLPIVYAKALNIALTDNDAKPGEVLSKGDGISAPILYRLGTPIKAQTGGETSAITELEFLAKTFGDVEEVMAETDQLGQAIALIRSVAKPLGVNDTLQRLPEWALEKFELADTFKISEEILPRFLE